MFLIYFLKVFLIKIDTVIFNKTLVNVFFITKGTIFLRNRLNNNNRPPKREDKNKRDYFLLLKRNKGILELS